MRLNKHVTPRATRRTFQDAMRDAGVQNVVVRSISGHLTEQMPQHYATARGREQEQAIIQVLDRTRIRDAHRGIGGHVVRILAGTLVSERKKAAGVSPAARFSRHFL